jgi:hypothetical protein
MELSESKFSVELLNPSAIGRWLRLHEEANALLLFVRKGKGKVVSVLN